MSGSSGYKAKACQSEGQDPGPWQEVTGATSLSQHPDHNSEPRRHKSSQMAPNWFIQTDTSDDPKVFHSYFRQDLKRFSCLVSVRLSKRQREKCRWWERTEKRLRSTQSLMPLSVNADALQSPGEHHSTLILCHT